MNPQVYHVHQDENGELSIDPDTFEPKPELVVAVNSKGQYSVVYNDEDRWGDSAVVAGTLYAIADAFLSRSGIDALSGPGLPDVRVTPESD